MDEHYNESLKMTSKQRAKLFDWRMQMLDNQDNLRQLINSLDANSNEYKRLDKVFELTVEAFNLTYPDTLSNPLEGE